MLFNTLEFWLFFLVVYSLFLWLRPFGRKLLILVASYFFYAAWDWRFLSLIWVSTLIDYFCARSIDNADDERKRKKFLLISVVSNLSLLGFFKYFNFFAESLTALASVLGLEISWVSLKIVLPVGISFYTFQTLSYTVEVYRRQISSSKSILDIAVYVAFFPQLVAGPIERAAHLLPQIKKMRAPVKSQVLEGVSLIIMGLFYKVYIADNLGALVDPVFANAQANGAEYLLATYAFAGQILGDFCGYSTIAIGLAKCMGISLVVNFNSPYFASDPRDFWRRWHISLSTWLRDYLYIPLGGNRGGQLLNYRNLLLTMLLGGLWHGAAWTFVVWGALHSVVLIVHRFLLEKKLSVQIPRFIKVIIFFHIVCLAWVFFRAQSFISAWNIILEVIFRPSLNTTSLYYFVYLLQFTLPLFLLEWLQYRYKSTNWLMERHWIFQGLIYGTCILLMLAFGVTRGKEFIYFQF